MWLRVDAQALRDGLYGYNAVLVGLALPTFLQPTAMLWACVVLGGAVSVVATLATANLIRTWQLSALTFPFVIVTWALLLAAFAFAGVGGEPPPYASDVEALDPALADPLDFMAFAAGVLLSISQVFLKASIVSSLLFLAGLAVSSIPAALFAVGGAVLAVLTAHLLGAESDLVSAGLLGFSPVLTAITVGTVFYAAECARRRLCRAGHGVHRGRAGGDERGLCAAGRAGADGALRADRLVVPAAAPAPGRGEGLTMIREDPPAGTVQPLPCSNRRLLLIVALFPLAFVLFGLTLDSPRAISQGVLAIISSRDTLITDYMGVGGTGAALVQAGLLTLLAIGCYIWREPRSAARRWPA